MTKNHPYIKNVAFEVTTPAGHVPQTDSSRRMTAAEILTVRRMTRLEAIKQYRVWTNSTLSAAILAVDAVRVD